jgi:8-oxo-dGTP pyrophosphatase MutT (NUDIX family)
MSAAATVSCGVLLFNEHDEVFLAHATGNRHWDVPKGLAEAGETPLAAALRETLEETGIRLDESGWLDLGRHGYRPGKDLHLFGRRVSTAQVRVADCVCTSMFVHARSGKPLPEADAFGWFGLDQLQERCAKSMAVLLVTKGLAAKALAALGPSPGVA